MRQLFGTDGVRGKAGDPPLDVPTIRRLGAALVRVLRSVETGRTQSSAPAASERGESKGPVIRLLAGRDTRESGGWIERELALGIRSQGGTLTSAGIIPTPAVAYLTTTLMRSVVEEGSATAVRELNRPAAG
jgi:phosphoglucosamine mutase